MLYLPSKIKYKYLLMFGIIICQILFMAHVQKAHYTDIKHLTFENKKLPQIYKILVNKISASNFLGYNFETRCQTYFEELNSLDEHWEISDLEGLDYSIDVLSPHLYYERKYEELKQRFVNDGKDIGDINTKDILNDLNAKLMKNRLVEEKIATSVSHLRVYGTCYITDRAKGPAQYQDCYNIETKLFPWLTFESPVFERWDGTIVNDYPRISDYYRYADEGDLNFKPSHDHCLLLSLKEKFNGKGIVLSIDDHLVEEAIKFIKTMRYLQNELPIQFVHKGDLSPENRLKLVDIARSNIIIKNSLTIFDYRQEIWFVDVSRCLQETHTHKFYMYRNKWLAVLFNSFEEMILMDTDVVTFIKPEQFFKFKGYKNSGTFFFKDRETGQQNSEASKELLLKLLPRDLENLFFEIPKATDFTLKSKFFEERAYHYMESGVVVINRKQRLLGLLISTQLQFWNPIASHTHGDKELFWLGQSFAGNEDYYFNPNPAGAVGRVNSHEFKQSDVIVGTQPAHVGPDNETLLWINSGAETCKRHSWEVDFKDGKKISNGFSSEEALKTYYLSPLDIEGVIIPPDAFHVFSNSEGEPDKGWRQLEHDGCDGYLWGGYSKVGGSVTSDPDSVGLKIVFSEEDKMAFRSVGNVWVRDHFSYRDGDNAPSEQLLNKYWKILARYGSVEEYEKKLNEDRPEQETPITWDASDDTSFLEDPVSKEEQEMNENAGK